MPSADVRARREAVVHEHIESENARDFDTTISTVLIRTDGHVARAGDGTHLGLPDALTAWFGAPHAE